MNTLQTPPSITPIVSDFCKQISNQNPIYIDIASTPFSQMNECFYNVEKQVKKKGGKSIFGWKIWIWPEHFIEAEFHSIWADQNHSYVDITPDDCGYKQILFLPDSSTTFEGYRVKTKRKNLSNNPLVNDIFLLSDAYFAITNHCPKNKPTSAEVITVQNLLEWKESISDLVKQGKGPNAPCPCGSNNKYKRCHAKSIRQGAKQTIKIYSRLPQQLIYHIPQI